MTPNYRNKYSTSVPFTIRLSSTQTTQLINLANRAQTKANVYLEELVEAALMAKMNPLVCPSYFQRIATEAAVCASGVEME